MQIDGKYFTKDGLTESDGKEREALEWLSFDRYLLKNKDSLKLLGESEFGSIAIVGEKVESSI